MKEIEFPCPRCGKQMKAPVEYAGRQVNCISCKQKVLIPAESQRQLASVQDAKVPRNVPPPPGDKQQPEQDLYQLRPSWKLLYEGMVVGLVASLGLAGVIGSSNGSIGVGFLVFILSMLVFSGLAALSVWLNRLGNLLKVTDKRCILQQGILSRATSEVRHTDVRNVRVKQSFINRLLNLGTLEVSTAAQSGIEITIKGIDEPHRIRHLIDSYHD